MRSAPRPGDAAGRTAASSLTGEKMWITNGGFADLFIVFAKVDGEQFTAFLVERAFPGVSTGKEEHKMGLHGSSTTPLILQDVSVPAGNVLGEIGKGHKVAFNVLNYGRFKLAAMCSGGARAAIGEAATYAAERRQFGQPIAALRRDPPQAGRDGDSRVRGRERCSIGRAGLIDAHRWPAAHAAERAVLAALEEFAIEASILKVAGSEMLDYVARRERADPRRQRVRPRLPGRTPLSRRARQPHLRRDQRDQPPADPRHADRRALKGGLPLIAAARGSGRTADAAAAEPPSDARGERDRAGMKKAALTCSAPRCRPSARRSPNSRRS